MVARAARGAASSHASAHGGMVAASAHGASERMSRSAAWSRVPARGM